MRHLGVIQNTGSRIVLLWLQLPDAPHRCLAVQVDSLPERFKDHVNRIMQSDEGQAAVELNAVLARHRVDGEKKDILTMLHQAGALIALPIDNVLMTPFGRTSIPLRDVLKAMGRVVPHGPPAENDHVEPRTMNKYEQNQQADYSQNMEKQAMGKLHQAKMLEQDAAKYRQEAYSMAPHLAPRQANLPPVEDFGAAEVPAQVQVLQEATPPNYSATPIDEASYDQLVAQLKTLSGNGQVDAPAQPDLFKEPNA